MKILWNLATVIFVLAFIGFIVFAILTVIENNKGRAYPDAYVYMMSCWAVMAASAVLVNIFGRILKRRINNGTFH